MATDSWNQQWGDVEEQVSTAYAADAAKTQGWQSQVSPECAGGGRGGGAQMNELGRNAETQLEPKLSSPTLLRGFPSRIEVWKLLLWRGRQKVLE